MYLLIYLSKGFLPWGQLKSEDGSDQHDLIMDKKLIVSTESLCAGLPIEFSEIIEDIKILEFDQVPNYSLYRQKFRELFLKEGYTYDYVYDWSSTKHEFKSKFSEVFQKKVFHSNCILCE